MKYGYSLVDALILSAILAITTSLSFPLIQQARETARSSHCENRIVQIGLKSLLYETIHERLPSQLGARGAVDWNEWVGNSSSKDYYAYMQNTSPLALLANMEGTLRMAPEYFDFSTPRLNYYFTVTDGWQSAFSMHREQYICPSDFCNQTSDRALFAIQPVYNKDPQTEDYLFLIYDQFGPGNVKRGFSNYAGCLGASTGGEQRAPSDFWQFRGMITSRETVTTAEIAAADGLSNSIMYGESLGTVVNGNVELRATWIGGGLARGRGSTAWMAGGSPGNPMLGRPARSIVYGYGSAHPAGVRFVMGDGSVRTISRDTDVMSFYELCGAFDTQ
ncbi:MAG: DUF1559 domain-containing protein [Planctomycetota bacterium]